MLRGIVLLTEDGVHGFTASAQSEIKIVLLISGKLFGSDFWEEKKNW